jgi:regulator of nucleoside diphosphate kinase
VFRRARLVPFHFAVTMLLHAQDQGGEMQHYDIPVITELDAARIRELGARVILAPKGLDPLSELMEMVTEHAEIVPARRVPADVVTVNSDVSFRDEATGEVQRVTIVYPYETSVSQRRISILSPVGRALLGQSVGRAAAVELPDGATRQIRVLQVHYQPEAAGEFTR